MENTTSRSKAPWIFGLAIAVVVLGGAIVFALSSRQPQTTDTTTQSESMSESSQSSEEPSTETAPNSGKNMTITYTDEGFTPQSITVAKGMTVTVKNESSMRVQFSSDEHPSHRANTEMNLMTLEPGESDTYTATRAGTWNYHDHIDESQTGSVTVTE